MLALMGSGPRPRPATLPEGAPANLAIEAATEYMEADAAYRAAGARLKQAQDHLFFILQSEWERSLQEGEPLTTVALPTVRGEVLQVVFQDRYRSLDGSNRAALFAALGPEYGNLIEEVEEVRFRPGMTVAELEKILGKATAARLLPHLTTRSSLRPRKGLVGALRDAVTQGGKLAEDLLDLVRATMATPQIRLPKKDEKITE